MMLKVKMNNPESDPFMCNKIQIILAYKLWEFPCTTMLYKLEKNKSWTLSVSGRTAYKVKLIINKASPDPTWIEVQGSEGGTLQTVLSDHGFNVGEFNLEIYADYVGSIGKVKIKKTKGAALGIKKLEIYYSGSQKKTIFNTSQDCAEVVEFIVPKPPSPPKPSGSALANAAAAVSAPAPDKTPVQQKNEAALAINLKEAGKHFNGMCLEKDDLESIKSVSCNAKFLSILN